MARCVLSLAKRLTRVAIKTIEVSFIDPDPDVQRSEDTRGMVGLCVRQWWPAGLAYQLHSTGVFGKRGEDMGDHIQDDSSRHHVGEQSTQGSRGPLASVMRRGAAHWKLALGIVLVVLVVVFVVQNAKAIHVKFLVWETDMSQALVIFLTLLSGVLMGVMVNRWQRWRLSRTSRGSS